MGRYAANTGVSPERTRQEIERTLTRYGATKFGYCVEEAGGATVAFVVHGMPVRVEVPAPALAEFQKTPQGRDRSEAAALAAQTAALRQRWRALGLLVKAKLEAIELGQSTVQREFLADVVLPGGKTVEQILTPQLMDLLSGKPARLSLTAGDGIPERGERR